MLTAVTLVLVALSAAPPHGFDDDLAFLRGHTEVVVLGRRAGARVAVAPE